MVNEKEVTVQLNEITQSDFSISSGMRVTLIGEITSDRTLDIIVGENATLTTYLIQKNGSFALRNVALAGAKIYSNLFYFGEGKVRIVNELKGDGSEAYDTELFAMQDESKLHIDTTLLHIGRNTSGNILVKGTVKDQSVAKVDGMIKIEKEGAGANSFLTEHVMLLNPGARADTNPQLEIENNDVSSRHAASVSPIDENKLFYLMARGVSREDARQLLIEGFLATVLDRIHSESVRSTVSELIEGAI